ncbi:hypothetical protein CYMTET_51431 [Cymbomonas tetramitiformis]|uniref:Band 7 domain-containing protein n=1 Tax=Cymbomonas tetramitiformis TaxID=36881 RepID=A0AAE0BM86_9CHLO|nr:hypothetical protein CYMTET_51431 [Cymbomonas tetramitiformis]
MFRGSSYHKNVIFGKRTVKDGEVCSLWTLEGRQKVIKGPKRQWIWRSSVRFLERVVAHQHQYLVVQHANGILEHIQGPKTMYVDPVQHVTIKVKDSVDVDSFEVLVVYTEQALGQPSSSKIADTELQNTSPLATSSQVHRRLVHGPTTFTPTANERIQHFAWHQQKAESVPSESRSSSGSSTPRKPGIEKFTKLSLLQQQQYVTVSDVITSDNVKIAVNLMIFYQCTDVDKMLDATNDPTGDFVNAVCADIMTFASGNTYQSFLEKTSSLSGKDIYPTLMQRAEAVGFCINKVIYRGYQGTDHMQKLHESSVKSRAELQVSAEEVSQKEKLKTLEEKSRAERAEAQRREEAASQEHIFKMELDKHRHNLELNNRKHEENLRQADEEHQQKLTQAVSVAKEHINHLSSMKAAGVDITKLVIGQLQAQSRSSASHNPDKVIQIQTGGNFSDIFRNLEAEQDINPTF